MGGGAETIQTKALLRSARILGRNLETRGDLLSIRPAANVGGENLQIIIIIIIIYNQDIGMKFAIEKNVPC